MQEQYCSNCALFNLHKGGPGRIEFNKCFTLILFTKISCQELFKHFKWYIKLVNWMYVHICLLLVLTRTINRKCLLTHVQTVLFYYEDKKAVEWWTVISLSLTYTWHLTHNQCIVLTISRTPAGQQPEEATGKKRCSLTLNQSRVSLMCGGLSSISLCICSCWSTWGMW